MTDKVYLVVCGMAENTKRIVGPYSDESDAHVAADAIKQVDFKDSLKTWGKGDTWVRVVEKKVIE